MKALQVLNILTVGIAVLWIADPAFAARIAFVSENPPFVAFDAGEEQGFVTDAEVCVVNDEQQPVHCARIERAKRHASAMSVPPEKIAGLKIGMEVLLNVPLAEPSFWSSHIGADLTLKPPFSFTLLKFNALAFADESQPVWIEENARPGRGLGFSLGVNRGPAIGWGLLLNLAKTDFPVDFVESDYSAADASQHAKTTANASTTQFTIAGRYWFTPPGENTNVAVDIGTAYDQVKIAMKTEVISDSTGEKREIASITATGGILSAVFGGTFEYRVGQLLLGSNIKILVPVWASEPKQTLRTSLPIGLPASGSDDYQTKFGYTKARHAETVVVYIGWSFK